ncbi:MAG TPA: DMT family protein [Fimbriiglobus sp.]|nr:DMT family protein [Fimbriiglobus sp.]
MRTVLLLIASNTFMTAAWYGHLKFRDKPLLLVIAVSWLIALPEYALQVPANRWGYGVFTATQLKIVQEAVSLGVFVAFAWLYLGEPPNWRSAAAMLLVVAAVALIRSGGDQHRPQPTEPTVEVRKEVSRIDPGPDRPVTPAA